jgi:hypothetical protein
MFVTLEKIAQVEPKYVDIVLLENYAAFQHRFFFFPSFVHLQMYNIFKSLHHLYCNVGYLCVFIQNTNGLNNSLTCYILSAVQSI